MIKNSLAAHLGPGWERHFHCIALSPVDLMSILLLGAIWGFPSTISVYAHDNIVQGPTTRKNTGNIRYAERFPGSDPCAQISAAENNLPPTGGIIYADYARAQPPCAAGILINKPTRLDIEAITIKFSTSPGIQVVKGGANTEIDGIGKVPELSSTVPCSPSVGRLAPLIQVTGTSNVKIMHLDIVGSCVFGNDSSSGGALIGVDVNQSNDVEVAFNTIEKFNYGIYVRDGATPVPGASTNPLRTHIHHNRFVGIFGPANGGYGIIEVAGGFGHFDHNEFGVAATPVDRHCTYLSLGSHHNETDNNTCYVGVISNNNAAVGFASNSGATSKIIEAGGCVRSRGLTTCSTNPAHAFVVGSAVTIGGITPSSFNGSFMIAAVPSSTTFAYTQTSLFDATSAGSGTASNTDVYLNNWHHNTVQGPRAYMQYAYGFVGSGAIWGNCWCDNIIKDTGDAGILVQSASATIVPHDNVICNNLIVRAQTEGILLYDDNRASVFGNVIVANGLRTNNFYSAIDASTVLASSSLDSRFVGNVIIGNTTGPIPKYAFQFSAKTSNFFVTANKVDGMGTGFINDAAAPGANKHEGNLVLGTAVGETCNIGATGALKLDASGVL
jgi:hypothetical protein